MPATATRRDQQRRQRGENRARIVDAAEAELRRKPFREVTIDEVMQAAGLTRTIFYRHFDDLPDLLLKVAGGAFQEVYAGASAIAEVEATDRASLRKALAQAIDAFALHGPIIRATAEAASFDAEVERVYVAVFERFVELTATVIPPAQHDARETARALTHMNVAYLIDSFGREPKVSPDEALDAIAAIWGSVLDS
jgi:AcrR family transcriptional regulator